MSTEGPSDTDAHHDVAIVGGGPAGCSAGVFTARYGLTTTIFDKGNSALRRCAYLENYLGFPAGIGIDVFHDLMHAHAREAGCDIVAETVDSVERGTSDANFVLETSAGQRHTAEYVIAASWYDGSYLRGLDTAAMFEVHEHHGEVEERFDPDYPDEDGRTPIEGLYVASPAGDRSAQAIVVAGHGAHVARCLLEDRRRDRGYSGGVAPHYDWLRPEAEFSGEWSDRDRWREWFHNEIPEGDDLDADPDEDVDADPDEDVDAYLDEDLDADLDEDLDADLDEDLDADLDEDLDADLDDDRLEELREGYIDRAFETRRSAEAIETTAERGIERLVTVIGTDRVLEAVDDTKIRQYVTETGDSTHE